MMIPVTLAVPAALIVAAGASASDGFDPYSLIGTVVTPVIVVILLLAGKLHTHSDYQRIADELEEEKTERLRLQTALTDRVIPALTRSTLVLEALSPLLQSEVRLRAAARNPDNED